ncbi:unnamed protein product [Bathycoccus prasinos]
MNASSCVPSSSLLNPRATSSLMSFSDRKTSSHFPKVKMTTTRSFVVVSATKDDDGRVATTTTTNRREMMGAMVTSVMALNTTTNKAYASESLGNVNVGDKAPEFTLPATGGGQIALSDILAENDYAVVYFYNQDGSTGCSIEAERFNQAQEQFKGKKARVLGVSMDSIESHEGFCDKKGLTFSLLSDGDGAVSKAYGAELTLPIFGKFSDRQTFLVGKDGSVKAKWKEMGAKVDEEKMASVKSTAHVEQVLAKM